LGYQSGVYQRVRVIQSSLATGIAPPVEGETNKGAAGYFCRGLEPQFPNVPMSRSHEAKDTGLTLG
jgi:hypothetical protein